MSERGESSATATTKAKEAKEWVEDLQRSVIQSKDSAIRSACSFQLFNPSSNLDFVPHAVSQYKAYENAFFGKVKVWSIELSRTWLTRSSVWNISLLTSAREHPGAAIGVALTVGLLLMRGPRRFLFLHTLGQLQSEEAQFLRAEKNVKELHLSVDLMKKESRKLLGRAFLAEKDLKRGETELQNAGIQVQHLAIQVYKVETQAADLMEGPREIPVRGALKLRAEVASMASLLKQQRAMMDKQIVKISELGVPV